MYLYKSLFSINKLNQNLVLFACSHCGGGWVHAFDSREGLWRYGFISFTKEVCVRSRSGEYVFKGSFSHLYVV